VDDDPSVREALRQLLRSASIHALAFESAEAFLASPQLPKVDCLVADVNLPGMSGAALVDTLGKSARPIPTILISARDDAHTLALIRSCGAVPFLRKPFGEDELLVAIAQALKW
jgi:FixJ family two-component response regulator